MSIGIFVMFQGHVLRTYVPYSKMSNFLEFGQKW